MYARYFRFKAKPGVRSEVEALADQMFAYIKTLKGFISVHFLVSEGEAEYGTFSLWETREDAESAGKLLREKSAEALQTLAAEPPREEALEVYKPGS
ncbi:antibiotic biosynthesis monooxygenase family protein [Pseudomonadota bacterium]